MEKQNDVHRGVYNLTTKPCSISKGSIGWKKPYTEMEKYLADMARANISRGVRCGKAALRVLKGACPIKGASTNQILNIAQ